MGARASLPSHIWGQERRITPSQHPWGHERRTYEATTSQKVNIGCYIYMNKKLSHSISMNGSNVWGSLAPYGDEHNLPNQI